MACSWCKCGAQQHTMRTTSRQSVTLTKPQVAFLKAESIRLGITLSDVIRRIIDHYREARGA
jgi:hypothetical protein